MPRYRWPCGPRRWIPRDSISYLHFMYFIAQSPPLTWKSRKFGYRAQNYYSTGAIVQNAYNQITI